MRSCSRILLACAAILGLPAAAMASGSPSEKPTPGPPPSAIEKTMTPEQKAAAARQAAVELYDSGYEEIDRINELFEEADRLLKAGDEDSTRKAEKNRESATKKYKKAIDRFKKAVDLVPEYYEAWNMLGYSYRKTGQLGNAFKAYETCLKLNPDYDVAHEYLGEAHLQAGNLDRAKRELAWLKEKKSLEEAAKLEAAIQVFENAKWGAASKGNW